VSEHTTDPTWDSDAFWDALIDAQLGNAPDPEPEPLMPPCGECGEAAWPCECEAAALANATAHLFEDGAA
jgi:hypothetical protein